MQTVLIMLGVLGFGAVVISAYVFIVAARTYVSDQVSEDENIDAEKLFVVRRNTERRQQSDADFPIELVTGEVIHMDRRRDQDRRMAG